MRTVATELRLSGFGEEQVREACWRRSAETPLRGWDYRTLMALGVLLAAFIGMQLLLPLGTAIKIGADEDYELSKATLYNHGYQLYSEIWDDQPPLVTFIIGDLLKHFSNSVLAPRLFTVGMGLVLLSAVFMLIRSVSGILPAAIGTAMLVASPGFLELSSSVMQEIPALALVVAALCVLWVGPRSQWQGTEIVAGLIFGFGLQMKMIGGAYLPIAGLMLWLRERGGVVSSTEAKDNGFVDATPEARPLRAMMAGGLAFGTSVAISFVVLNFLTGNSLMLEMRQAWAAHFAAATSFEYGSPEQYRFDWGLLIKNWETTVPAALGLGVVVRRVRLRKVVLIPISWLMLTFAVFAMHKPWWAYYYVHNALPLCWLAGVGVGFAWQWFRAVLSQQASRGREQRRRERSEARLGGRSRFGGQTNPSPGAALPVQTGSLRYGRVELCVTRRRWQVLAAVAVLFGMCAASWMGARVYLEAQAMRKSPRLSSSLVLQEIERFKPYTQFMFSDQAIYSFHADIPMPPHLAVLSLKRLWSGDMSGARLNAELRATKPGLILLGNTSGEVPFQELLNEEYRLVYQDNKDRLYALGSIVKKPPIRGL